MSGFGVREECIGLLDLELDLARVREPLLPAGLDGDLFAGRLPAGQV